MGLSFLSIDCPALRGISLSVAVKILMHVAQSVYTPICFVRQRLIQHYGKNYVVLSLEPRRTSAKGAGHFREITECSWQKYATLLMGSKPADELTLNEGPRHQISPRIWAVRRYRGKEATVLLRADLCRNLIRDDPEIVSRSWTMPAHRLECSVEPLPLASYRQRNCPLASTRTSIRTH
jgi:hypothetical protein